MSGRPEVLAPAGSFAAMKAAVVNGADAVYLGMGEFNARAKAENFTRETLPEAVEYAHLHGVKVYLALNTLLKDEEIHAAADTALFAEKVGADAFIIQDIGLLRLLAGKTNVPLHASTQMGIHNAEGAIVAEKLGIKRVILSRETLIEDIRRIKNETNLEIEVFVQGALCVAFSGNCYFSSIVSGYSGNRGKCLQLCRKKYVADFEGRERDGYWLSAKDLRRDTAIKDLIEAGVDSFKIEGRLRRNEYVAEAVRYYRGIVDGKRAEDNLKRLFNRGDYTLGQLYRHSDDVIESRIQGHKGERVGRVVAVKNGNAVLDCALNCGDGVKFIRNGYEVGSAAIKTSGNSTGFEGKVRVGDEVFITTDSRLCEKINARTKPLRVDMSVEMNKDGTKVVAVCGDSRVGIAFSDAPQAAQAAPLSVETVTDSFSKSGDTLFEISNISVDLATGLFYPRSRLNAMRREVLSQLRNRILSDYERRNRAKIAQKPLSMSDIVFEYDGKTELIIQVSSRSQLDDEMINAADLIVFRPYDYGAASIETMLDLPRDKLALSLPNVARGDDINILKNAIGKFDTVVVNNLYGIELARGKKILFGPQMNFINKYSASTRVCSYEDPSPKGIVYKYGRPPLMTFCHCVYKTLGKKCGECGGKISLTDDKGERYDVVVRKVAYCYGELIGKSIYNAYNSRGAFLDFCGVAEGECREIFNRLTSGGEPQSAYFARRMK